MNALVLAGKVRDIAAEIALRGGHVEAAKAIFWTPAPLLLAATPARRRAFRRDSSAESNTAALLTELRRLESLSRRQVPSKT